MNIVNCAPLGALVLSMPERLTDFYEYPGGSGYEGRFTRCGICTLMQELGSYDLTLALCHPDYTMSETGGATSFVRMYTLVSGGPYCDCGYKKCVKKVPLCFLVSLLPRTLMPVVPNSTPAANMANLFMADRSSIFCSS